jgi:hypothetical protein
MGEQNGHLLIHAIKETGFRKEQQVRIIVDLIRLA